MRHEITSCIALVALLAEAASAQVAPGTRVRVVQPGPSVLHGPGILRAIVADTVWITDSSGAEVRGVLGDDRWLEESRGVGNAAVTGAVIGIVAGAALGAGLGALLYQEPEAHRGCDNVSEFDICLASPRFTRAGAIELGAVLGIIPGALLGRQMGSESRERWRRIERAPFP